MLCQLGGPFRDASIMSSRPSTATATRAVFRSGTWTMSRDMQCPTFSVEFNFTEFVLLNLKVSLVFLRLIGEVSLKALGPFQV